MARDSGVRQHELLKLRMKDIVFNLSPGKKQQYEVLVNGKLGPEYAINKLYPMCQGLVGPWISTNTES
jgi:hypothetical protein